MYEIEQSRRKIRRLEAQIAHWEAELALLAPGHEDRAMLDRRLRDARRCVAAAQARIREFQAIRRDTSTCFDLERYRKVCDLLEDRKKVLYHMLDRGECRPDDIHEQMQQIQALRQLQGIMTEDLDEEAEFESD